MPLRVEDTVFGSLTFAAPEPDAFDEKEKQILVVSSDDLAFGLASLLRCACVRGRRTPSSTWRTSMRSRVFPTVA